jgi:hypothetical protein
VIAGKSTFDPPPDQLVAAPARRHRLAAPARGTGSRHRGSAAPGLGGTGARRHRDLRDHQAWRADQLAVAGAEACSAAPGPPRPSAPVCRRIGLSLPLSLSLSLSGFWPDSGQASEIRTKPGQAHV